MKSIHIILLSIAGLAVGFILFLIICALAVDPKKEYDKHSRLYRWIVNLLTAFALGICGVKVTLIGKEKMPENERFLIVSNHCSNFDALAVWHVLKEHDISYISKPSNFKLPALGMYVKRCCFLEIDRENARNALKTMHTAAELIKSDQVSIGIFPEGTRDYGKELLPFHNGVFKIAQLAEVPIVVASVKGADDIHNNAPFKRTNVYVEILDVLPTDYVKETKRAVISDRVRKSILNSLGMTEDNALES